MYLTSLKIFTIVLFCFILFLLQPGIRHPGGKKEIIGKRSESTVCQLALPLFPSSGFSLTVSTLFLAPFPISILELIVTLFSARSLLQASSVRALGVFVLYQCLREDVLFVADTANTVLSAMTDPKLLVRMRAAWSLANLSDSLVTNM